MHARVCEFPLGPFYYSDNMILGVGVRHIDRAAEASVTSLYIITNTIVTIGRYLILQHQLLGEY